MSEPGTAGATSETDDEHKRDETDEEREAFRLAEVADDVPELLEEIATALLDRRRASAAARP